MKFDELLALQKKARKRPENREHYIQASCVEWFRYNYQNTLSLNLFAIPNGGRRDKVTGALLKEEGVLAGVADLILLVPNKYYHGLLIEMKDIKGRQSESQKAWQKHMAQYGYKYVVCHSLDEFIAAIKQYLADEQ